MTMMQVEARKLTETQRANRERERISEIQADAARQHSINEAKSVKLQQEMAGWDKFNKAASGIGAAAKGVGSLINPFAGMANAGTAAAASMANAETAANANRIAALIRQGY